MKICAVTGTRAEYGILYWVLKKIEEDPAFELRLFVTGAHLSPEFGSTFREIEADGFRIDEKIEILLSSDTPVAVAKSMGIATIGFAEAYARHQPDMVLMLGDRYELLAAAQAALVARIPIAHISGGDVTEGAFDEAIRHSITKMSHLHFPTTQRAARRIRQLGENPAHIHLSGNPSLDHLKHLSLMDREEFEKFIGLKLRSTNLLVTFHPVTLGDQPSAKPFQELLTALERLGEDVGLIFTRPNADPEGRILIRMTEAFVAARPNAVCHASLGQRGYYSAMRHVDAVVGNSSSGLLEAPSLKVPTVNIGDRQKGRVEASSVISAPSEANAIYEAVRQALVMDCSGVINPYGDGHAADRIVAGLKNTKQPNLLIIKPFFDLCVPDSKMEPASSSS